MKVLVINGPNLNMLGHRDKSQYGEGTYQGLIDLINGHCGERNIEVEFLQTSYEGAIIDAILNFSGDGIVLNAGALAHYSYAIRDAIECGRTSVCEVHISDIYKRETFRQKSVIEEVCKYNVVGQGFIGYLKCIDFLTQK